VKGVLREIVCAVREKQASGFRLQASGFRLQASGFRLQASGFGLWALGFGLRASGFGWITSGAVARAEKAGSSALRFSEWHRYEKNNERSFRRQVLLKPEAWNLKPGSGVS
jgi:hypothetical protein